MCSPEDEPPKVSRSASLAQGDGRQCEHGVGADAGKSQNGVRIYDCNGYRRRAAALCFRVEKGEIQLLLVTAGSKRYWILPGGGLEAHETLEEAVRRELKEEAGVEGEILLAIDEPCLDTERLHLTHLFILSPTRVLDDWEERVNGRNRCWMNTSTALECIKPCQSAIIERNLSKIRAILSRASDG